MKPSILLLIIVFAISCKPNQEPAPTQVNTDATVDRDTETTESPKITFLSSFHFGNTTDYSAIVMDDVKSEKRQAELEQLVADIAAYKPTKILVERPPSFTDSLKQRLVRYKSGNYELPANEIYQLGFRLAKKVDTDNIYGIDHQMGLGDQELLTYLSDQGLMDEFSEVLSSATEWTHNQTEFLEKHSIGESLQRINSTESDQFNKNLYLEHILNITENGNSPASDYVSNWYRRNIYIKKNIDDLVEKDDRILVIIGAGHSAILKDFYKSSHQIEYIELSDFMKG